MRTFLVKDATVDQTLLRAAGARPWPKAGLPELAALAGGPDPADQAAALRMLGDVQENLAKRKPTLHSLFTDGGPPPPWANGPAEFPSQTHKRILRWCALALETGRLSGASIAELETVLMTCRPVPKRWKRLLPKDPPKFVMEEGVTFDQLVLLPVPAEAPEWMRGMTVCGYARGLNGHLGIFDWRPDVDETGPGLLRGRIPALLVALRLRRSLLAAGVSPRKALKPVLEARKDPKALLTLAQAAAATRPKRNSRIQRPLAWAWLLCQRRPTGPDHGVTLLKCAAHAAAQGHRPAKARRGARKLLESGVDVTPTLVEAVCGAKVDKD